MYHNNIIQTLNYLHIRSIEFSLTGLGFFQNSFWHVIIAFKHSWKHLLIVHPNLLKLKPITHSSNGVLKYIKTLQAFPWATYFYYVADPLSHEKAYMIC